MLSHAVITRKDAGEVAAYYEEASGDEYYLQEKGAHQWQGRGAETLGLSGQVDSDRFTGILSGEIEPGRNVRLSRRRDQKERLAIDFTFSPPKSVSIAALVGVDRDIIAAHQTAVTRTLEVAETLTQARRMVNGKSQIETTGNFIVAKFLHSTSRERDPQLHTHAVIANLTQRADGKWVAIKNDALIKSTRYLGAVYNAELALELTNLGYGLRHGRDGNFELEQISRAQIARFSYRGAQVEAALAEQGLTRDTATAAQKQQATLASRKKKVPGDEAEIFKEWQDRARSLGIDFTKPTPQLGERSKEVDNHVYAEAGKRAMRYAINHHVERTAIVDERTLIDTAMKHVIGHARLSDVQTALQNEVTSGFLVREAPIYKPAAFGWAGEPKTREKWLEVAPRERVDAAIKAGGLVPVEARYTTQHGIERERQILNIERTGRGAVTPILSPEIAATRLHELTGGQKEAAVLIASTPNQVVGIQGYAGTGKSHLLKATKKLVEAQGFTFRAIAPYGQQVKELQRNGVDAVTVAAFLYAKDKHLDARTVLVLDESAVVPTRQMAQVLSLVQKAGARIVLVGDINQTKAIEAGKPMAQLQAAGMATVVMDEIKRQKNPELRAAVEYAAKGDTVNSLANIKSVEQIKDGTRRREKIAADYLALSEPDRAKSLVISGTNLARRHINEVIREGLGTNGKGIEFDALIRRDTSKEERKWSRYWRIDDVVQPERDYPNGLKRGQTYSVVETGPGNFLTVRDSAGAQIKFNPMQHTQLSVYEPERLELSVGDKVRITRNDAKLDVANGDRMAVSSVAKDKVTLTDGKRSIELPADRPLHLDYAHASTVYSAQGLTAARVFYDADSQKQTTARDTYYVGISRAKHEARIYTDSLEGLPPAIAREHVKHSALDLERTRYRRELAA